VNRRAGVTAALALGLAALVSTAAGGALSAAPEPLRIAVLTDCKGPVGPDGWESAIGGAQAAFYEYAGARPVDPNRPSAGMTGGSVAGRAIELLYGCGDASAATARREARRLVDRLHADVLIGPLSGDEAVAIAHFAETHPTTTFVIGTAASQSPTLEIAPRNLFRYHGDGAQWNAGLGELVYRRLGWRTAAIVADDYSFGWTSAAGFIADFCAIGGRIVSRVFPPLGSLDYSIYMRQLPAPTRVDGYFWAVGGTGTGPALKAFERAFGPLKATQHTGNVYFAFLVPETGIRNLPGLRNRLVGAYAGGISTAPGLRTRQAKRYEAVIARWHPGLPAAVGYVYNYFNAAWATIRGLRASGGRVGEALRRAMPRTSRSGYEHSDGGLVRLDANRQAIQDQHLLRVVRGPDGKPTLGIVAMVPNVDQSFGGVFRRSGPAPSRTQPPCVERRLPWQGKLREVRAGAITSRLVR
jgi:branched-chain amino acid transport system substrate-binding protein